MSPEMFNYIVYIACLGKCPGFHKPFIIQSLWGRLSLLEERCSPALPHFPPSAKGNTRRLDIWEKHISLVALKAHFFVIISLLFQSDSSFMERETSALNLFYLICHAPKLFSGEDFFFL